MVHVSGNRRDAKTRQVLLWFVLLVFSLTHTHTTTTDDGPLPPAVVLIVINAIYLKASWRKPFYAERTSVDVFYTADRSTVQRSEAIFMHQLDYFPYSSTAVDNYQIVQLPFDNTLSMILAVPVVKNAPLTNASAVLAALPQLESQQRVALALPKFQFEREYLNDLKAAMLNAGVNLPFGPGHLCVYENDCSPALEIVIQKTFISVDEKGVRTDNGNDASVDSAADSAPAPLTIHVSFFTLPGRSRRGHHRHCYLVATN